jgi:ribosomal protein L20
MCEAAPFLRDADFLATAEGKFQRAVKDFNAARKSLQGAGKAAYRARRAAEPQSGYNIMTDR